MNPVNDFAKVWLGGAKYALSERLYGASWTIEVAAALSYYGITLGPCKDMHDVVRIFRGRWFWVSDGFYALWDTVKPPDHLLAEGGDDCDGMAMLHTQAMNAALGRYGWKAVTVSYLADPWWMSHHYTELMDPQGHYWAVQPQPTKEQWDKDGEANQTVYGPYASPEETLAAVTSQYKAKAVWHDVRDGLYRPITI